MTASAEFVYPVVCCATTGRIAPTAAMKMTTNAVSHYIYSHLYSLVSLLYFSFDTIIDQLKLCVEIDSLLACTVCHFGRNWGQSIDSLQLFL